MAGFVEIVAIAFVAQLLVLPGEKVQFIIAGLATKYHPLLVVGAAGTAFAAWTAVEITFGAAVRGILPRAVMNVVTAILFLTFAVLLLRSAPSTNGRTMDARADGGEAVRGGADSVTIVGRELSLSGRLGTFVPIFGMMAVGEFGDKTQMVTISLAMTYGATPAIWVGEMLAIIPISLANAYFFHRIATEIDLRKAHFAGAAVFLFFGLDTLLSVATGVSVWETVVHSIADLLLVLV